MFKKMKNSYIYMNLILSDLPLIENPPLHPWLMILDTFVGPHPTIQTSHAPFGFGLPPPPPHHLFGTVENMLFKIVVFIVTTEYGKEKPKEKSHIWFDVQG